MGLKPKPTRNWIIQIQLGFGQYKATKELDNIKPNRNMIPIQSQIFIVYWWHPMPTTRSVERVVGAQVTASATSAPLCLEIFGIVLIWWLGVSPRVAGRPLFSLISINILLQEADVYALCGCNETPHQMKSIDNLLLSSSTRKMHQGFPPRVGEDFPYYYNKNQWDCTQ